MKRTLVLSAAALAALVIAAPARAITISFVPPSTTVDIGDPIDIEVRVEGLGTEIVSAYDLDVVYDSTIVSATGVTFGPFLGDETLLEVFNGAILGLGVIDFFAVSLLSDDELAALQPGSFVLATLSFVALAPGTTTLFFDENAPPGVDIKGRDAAQLVVTPGTGRINVREGVEIPEPSTLWLGLVGLLAARELRRRRAR